MEDRMRFTLAQLEAFYWIAKLGTVRDAARHLNLAQPTVSLRIRDLEAALGTVLFERLGRAVRLTHEGLVLLQDTTPLLEAARQIQERSGTHDAVGGTIRLGVPETFAVVCLPKLVDLLSREHPALRLELDIATSATLVGHVENRQIDLAFVASPEENPRLRLLALGQHEFAWIAHMQLEVSPPVRPADLRHLPIISNPHPSPQCHAITDWFRSAGLEPLRLSFCNSVSVIAHLVAAGVAISVLPLPMVQHEIATGRLKTLASRPRISNLIIYACYRAAEASANINAVIRATRQVLSEISFLAPV
jgi:DNA-binding transcriptional LysR family regulator